MECSIYDENLTRLGVISTFVSLVWEERYADCGTFQISVVQIDGISDLLKPDRYVGIKSSDTLMIIKSVQIIDKRVVADGYAAVNLLSDRVSVDVVSNTNAESAMRGLVQRMNPWPRVELGAVSGLADVFTAQKSDATILDYCRAIGEAADMGFKLRYDRITKKLLFECYKPAKNPNLRFSTLYGNMGGIEYSNSTANYKNVAVVAGAGEGENRITVYAGDTSSIGTQRREMYVDARQDQPQEGETTEEYKARLVRIGEEKLLGQVKIENFKFILDDDRAKLGDIVSCAIPEIGVKLEVRITGITLTSQNNQNTIEASMGTPIVIRRY